MTDNGNIYATKVALVVALAKQLGEDMVVMQCPICGAPHRKVEAEDLEEKITGSGKGLCDDCRGDLETGKTPRRFLR